MWGPIEVTSGKAASQLFYSTLESPEIRIKAEVIENNKHFLVYPAEPLKAGEIYLLKEEGRPKPVIKNIRIRKACILYLVHSNASSALWENCPDTEPFQLSKPDEAIEDYSISQSGELIIYTRFNDAGGNEIWQVNRDGTQRKMILDCSTSNCSNLGLDSFASKLVFIKKGLTQQIELMDLKTGNLIFIERSGSEISLSQDGRYLSLLDDGSGKLSVIDLENKNQITVQSGNGLMGEWARDSQSILYGEMDFWGGIPGVKVNELEIPSGEIKPILFDPSQSLEFYQPSYTHVKGIYLASVRLRSSGASRQLWLLREGAEKIKQITTDPQFHYSSPSWSPDYSELVFQRFPINKSDGHPQVVVWNQDSDTFRIIAENASKPLWLP